MYYDPKKTGKSYSRMLGKKTDVLLENLRILKLIFV
jgi:hypothetical protein